MLPGGGPPSGRGFPGGGGDDPSRYFEKLLGLPRRSQGRNEDEENNNYETENGNSPNGVNTNGNESTNNNGDTMTGSTNNTTECLIPPNHDSNVSTHDSTGNWTTLLASIMGPALLAFAARRNLHGISDIFDNDTLLDASVAGGVTGGSSSSSSANNTSSNPLHQNISSADATNHAISSSSASSSMSFSSSASSMSSAIPSNPALANVDPNLLQESILGQAMNGDAHNLQQILQNMHLGGTRRPQMCVHYFQPTSGSQGNDPGGGMPF